MSDEEILTLTKAYIAARARLADAKDTLERVAKEYGDIAQHLATLANKGPNYRTPRPKIADVPPPGALSDIAEEFTAASRSLDELTSQMRAAQLDVGAADK